MTLREDLIRKEENLRKKKKKMNLSIKMKKLRKYEVEVKMAIQSKKITWKNLVLTR
jgi:hypothetical protein